MITTNTSKGAVSKWIDTVLKTTSEACVNWPFAVRDTGYPVARYKGGNPIPVHSTICTLTHGERPPKAEASHKCGNRLCCNPNHLNWMQPKENRSLKVSRGTHNRGDKHPLAKLTEEQVVAIWNDDRYKLTIAAEYKISEGTVRDIWTGRKWSHITNGFETREDYYKAGASGGERAIRQFLKSSGYKYREQWSDPKCIDKGRLRFDFYIDPKILIEFDGRQHFEVVSVFGGQPGFEAIKHRDNLKNQFATLHGYTLIRIPYWESVEKFLENALAPISER